MLGKNRHKKRPRKTLRSPGLLEGLLHCTACQSPMIHTYTSKGPRRYRYYTCSGAQKHGWASCPSKSIPAMEVEQFVIKEARNARPGELDCQDSSSQWLSTAERAKLLSGIVRCVEYDGRQGELKIKLLPGGGNQPV
jgi:hypothetical protein